MFSLCATAIANTWAGKINSFLGTSSYKVEKTGDSTTDGKHWTVRIRPDVYFHDGQQCTAYDVEATINEILRLAESGLGQYNQLRYIISKVSVNSAESLQITVSRPYYAVRFAFTFPVLPRDQVQAAQPAGTGPFKVDQFIPANLPKLFDTDEFHRILKAFVFFKKIAFGHLSGYNRKFSRDTVLFNNRCIRKQFLIIAAFCASADSYKIAEFQFILIT